MSNKSRPMNTIPLNGMSHYRPAYVPDNKPAPILPSTVITSHLADGSTSVQSSTSDVERATKQGQPTGESVWLPYLSLDSFCDASVSIPTSAQYYKRIQRVLELYHRVAGMRAMALEQARYLRSEVLHRHFKEERIRKAEEARQAREKAMILLGITPEQLALLQSI